MEADDVVCVETPEMFYGVGQFYRDFSQTSDEEVNELLDRASPRSGDQRYDNREATGRNAHQ
jgi:predicted phosphoribosyltransferase